VVPDDAGFSRPLRQFGADLARGLEVVESRREIIEVDLDES
jgi:hypothetical protein